MGIFARIALICVRIARNHDHGAVLRSFERRIVPFETSGCDLTYYLDVLSG